MNRASEKAVRLLQIEKLLLAHPGGLTRAEIARRLQINRSTITQYLDKGHLPPSIYEDDLNGNRLKVDRKADLARTSLNLHEILAIHLATRLLATRSDKQNLHAASALRILGMALQRLDECMSRRLLRSADAMDEQAAFRDPIYLDVLEKLIEAWSAGRKVRVTHEKTDGEVREFIFSPCFIETRRHRGEQHEEQPDGFLVWRARNAQPLKMLPWVRGWGADVEVLAPGGLRAELTHEATRLSEMYGERM